MTLSSTIRFLPFSHIAGTLCVLPGSHIVFEVFPAHIKVYSLAEGTLEAQLNFKDIGPLAQFTVLQDHEKCAIVVSGFAKSGFMRYSLTPGGRPLDWNIECDKLSVQASIDMGVVTPFAKGTKLSFSIGDAVAFSRLQTRQRLFLGVDKSQEWPQVMRRGSVQEILPFIYSLAQTVPSQTLPENKGSSLFTAVQQAVYQKNRALVVGCMKDLFLAGFHGLLVPRTDDNDHQGFSLPIVDKGVNPVQLLQGVFRLIQSLFIQERDSQVHILPVLPPEYSCGMLTDIVTTKGHSISIEWTKHTIRRLSITCANDDEINFSFQNFITSFRLGNSRFSNGDTIKIRKNHTYLLDNFMK